MGLSSCKIGFDSILWATFGELISWATFFISKMKSSQGNAHRNRMNIRRLYSSSAKNLYKILGVSENSNSPEIKKAYFEVNNYVSTFLYC